MTIEEVQRLIAQGINAQQVKVSGDGSMFDVLVVAEQFEGLSSVKKQQLVYTAVKPQITSGEIHALTIKAYTPSEWATASKLQIG